MSWVLATRVPRSIDCTPPLYRLSLSPTNTLFLPALLWKRPTCLPLPVLRKLPYSPFTFTLDAFYYTIGIQYAYHFFALMRQMFPTDRAPLTHFRWNTIFFFWQCYPPPLLWKRPSILPLPVPRKLPYPPFPSTLDACYLYDRGTVWIRAHFCLKRQIFLLGWPILLDHIFASRGKYFWWADRTPYPNFVGICTRSFFSWFYLP